MRWLVCTIAVAIAGCDPAIRQVGPGDPADTDDTGGEGGQGSGWSCDRRATAGICEDYVGSGWDEPQMQADCGQDVLSPVECPPSDIGGCNQTRQNPLGTIVWYYQGDFYTDSDAGFLESQCTLQYYEWIPR